MARAGTRQVSRIYIDDCSDPCKQVRIGRFLSLNKYKLYKTIALDLLYKSMQVTQVT
jgi:hypothetical protein